MALEGTGVYGRIVIDCGFTKLMKEFWPNTAGTKRYVYNCATWLLWTDRMDNWF